MRLRSLICSMLCMILASTAMNAQFYQSGSDPASVRWMQLTTDNYRLIYPRGMDSLARAYARSLEQVRGPVGDGTGMLPNCNYRRPMPVVLHPFNTRSNGTVVWTPRRVELLTTPEAVAPEPVPWMEQLTVHESRHISQMQYIHDRKYLPGNILLGEIFAGGLSSIYCGQWFYEGDAVLAETALTKDGRGRNASFLEYYRASFEKGEKRNWYRWRYDSQNLFTPDHYTLGYITMAGMAAYFNDPKFTARYYENLVGGWPFPLLPFRKSVRQVSGLKFREAFDVICDSLATGWDRDRAARAPFMEMDPLTPKGRYFESYTGTAALGDKLFSIRSGIAHTPELVSIESTGKVRRIGSFSYYGSPLHADPAGGRIWWAESVPDLRWEMRSFSEIWYADSLGHKHALTRRTRYWNPAPSPDGSRLAVVQYPEEGGSAICILDTRNGSEISRCAVPGGLQAVEVAWIGNTLYASAISLEGTAVYKVSDWSPVAAPSHMAMKELFVRDGRLFFTSDRGGVNELYALDPDSGECVRISNTPQGASSFCYRDSTLFYSSLATDGRAVFSTSVGQLPNPVKTALDSNRSNALADTLSAHAPSVDRSMKVRMSEPKPYSKAAHMLHFHSWLPLYFNSDAIDNLSFDNLFANAGLGATAFFQDLLGTTEGSIAYHASPATPEWSHSLLGKITYRGLYPVIEANGSISTSEARQYYLDYGYHPTSFHRVMSLTSRKVNLPSVNGDVRIYVPLNFNSGGWSRGLIPQLRTQLSNSVLTHGQNYLMGRVTASMRGYVMQPTPRSCIYPRLGIGLEGGYSGRFGVTDILSPDIYGYAYGYLPGFVQTHGIRLTAIVQKQLGDAPFRESYAAVTPRGFVSASQFSNRFPLQSKFTLDYALPFGSVDWTFLCPAAYLRNFEAIAHTDWSLFGGNGSTACLGSVGVDLCAHLGNFFFLPYDTRIGLSMNYCLGPSYGSAAASGSEGKRLNIGFLFNIDIQ